MEYKHIEYFIEASKYASMSKAAEALYISQQALSKTIQNLETELGVRLFQRTAKGSHLTEEGKALLAAFQPVMNAFQAAENEIATRFANQPHKITLAAPPMLFSQLFTDLLISFKEKYPGFELEIEEKPDVDVAAYVRTDPSHLGILGEPEHWHGEHPGFTTVKTWHFSLCVHKDNPLASRDSVSFADLKDQKLLMMDKRSFYQEIVRRKSEECGFSPQIVFESADVHQLCSLVDKNKGVFIAVPVEAHALFKNLVTVPFSDDDMNLSIGFVYQSLDKLEPYTRKFIEYTQEYAKEH